MSGRGRFRPSGAWRRLARTVEAAAGLAAVSVGLACGGGPEMGARTGDLPPSGVIRIDEGMTMTVVTSEGRLSYRIRAGAGALEEESRRIELGGPEVEIYDAAGEVKDRITGREGSAWPVELVGLDADGVEKRSVRYDWAVRGDVRFASSQGYALEAPQIQFNRADYALWSDGGVRFRLPTGRGLALEGTAERFIAQLDGSTGGIKRWEVFGEARLVSSKAEQAP